MEAVIIDYLETLKNEIRSGTISKDKFRSVVNMYLDHKEPASNEPEPVDKNTIRYLFLGWYIYNLLSEDKTRLNAQRRIFS